MTIKINPDNLTEQGKETLRNWLEERLLGREKVEDQAEKKIAETLTQELEPEIKHSRELPAGLPGYAYEVDKNFKNETGDNRNPEMMKKIDEVVLKMREEGIIETKSKDGGVYTTINFPKEKPIHFLEPDLTKHSDEEYKCDAIYSFGGKKVHKDDVELGGMIGDVDDYWDDWDDEVKLGGMIGDVDDWENEKLKKYIKNSGLDLPEQSSIENFMQKLSDFVNQKYQLNISNEKEKIDLFCRAMNSIGGFWFADHKNSSRSCFFCTDYYRCFHSGVYDFDGASFFLTDYLL